MKEEIEISDILNKLLKKAKAERVQAQDTKKTDDQRREHLNKANEYLSKINEIVPEEMQMKLYTVEGL